MSDSSKPTFWGASCFGLEVKRLFGRSFKNGFCMFSYVFVILDFLNHFLFGAGTSNFSSDVLLAI